MLRLVRRVGVRLESRVVALGAGEEQGPLVEDDAGQQLVPLPREPARVDALLPLEMHHQAAAELLGPAHAQLQNGFEVFVSGLLEELHKLVRGFGRNWIFGKRVWTVFAKWAWIFVRRKLAPSTSLYPQLSLAL